MNYTILVMFESNNIYHNRSFIVNYKNRLSGMKAVKRWIDKNDNELSYAYNNQGLKSYAIYTESEYKNMIDEFYFNDKYKRNLMQ